MTRELKRVWTKTTLAEKIALIADLLAIAGLAGYGLATMPRSQQQGVLDLIIGDEDMALQRPLPEKTLLNWEFKF